LTLRLRSQNFALLIILLCLLSGAIFVKIGKTVQDLSQIEIFTFGFDLLTFNFELDVKVTEFILFICFLRLLYCAIFY